jgi:hypothetical protein
MRSEQQVAKLRITAASPVEARSITPATVRYPVAFRQYDCVA